MRAEIEALVYAAKPEVTKPSTTGLVLIDAHTVKQTIVEWLWSGRFAIGAMAIVSGNPGLGKSSVTLDIAARVSSGIPFPDPVPGHSGSAPKVGSVLILSGEDSVTHTIVPRLAAMGANLKKVKIIDAVRRPAMVDGVASSKESTFSLEADIAALERTIDELSDVRLLVIDPISVYMGKSDSYKNSDVRAVLAPLAAMAARKGVAVIMVTHNSKGGGNGNAVLQPMGSLAFIAASRTGYAVFKDKEDESLVHFLPIKNNLGKRVPGLMFRIDGPDDGTGSAVDWSPEPSDETADEMAGGDLTAPERAKREPMTLLEFATRAGAAGVSAGEASGRVRLFRGDADAAETAMTMLVAEGKGEWLDPVVTGKRRPKVRRFRVLLTPTPPSPDIVSTSEVFIKRPAFCNSSDADAILAEGTPGVNEAISDTQNNPRPDPDTERPEDREATPFGPDES